MMNNVMQEERLSLKAQNFEECDILSALLQDSILPFSFRSFHEDKKCLRLLLNRFCWESINSFDREKCHFRVHAGLYIYNVDYVRTYGDMAENRYLNLLALHSSPTEINLIFSGNKQICVGINRLLVYMKDLHVKYPTLSLPVHHDLS
ncbi:MAG: DUF2948 family protein [Holosporaceae bacterium]|jgi:hypothetical protein|nr:DUF2948 family protein [Holosporaceae bacterium]